MPYTTPSDVAIYVDLEDVVEDTVETLLEQAEAQILLEFPDLDDRVADGRTSLILLKRVEAEMVSSVLRNPKGYASESSTIGSLSQSYTVNLAVASGLLQLTDAHRVLLRGTDGRSSALFTIRPDFGLALVPNPWECGPWRNV